ncbi:MAG: DinB family protein [Bacteroidota bacterium]
MNWLPLENEYADFYAGYVANIKGKNVLRVLEEQLAAIPPKLADLSKSQWAYRYAEGKWSVKELIGHLTDAERVFAYRAWRFGRGDTETELPGFDENAYVKGAHFDTYSVELLIQDWQSTRMGTLSLRRGLTDEMGLNSGIASGKRMSVRALFAVTAGHTIHHINVLNERYGLAI